MAKKNKSKNKNNKKIVRRSIGSAKTWQEAFDRSMGG